MQVFERLPFYVVRFVCLFVRDVRQFVIILHPSMMICPCRSAPSSSSSTLGCYLLLVGILLLLFLYQNSQQQRTIFRTTSTERIFSNKQTGYNSSSSSSSSSSSITGRVSLIAACSNRNDLLSQVLPSWTEIQNNFNLLEKNNQHHNHDDHHDDHQHQSYSSSTPTFTPVPLAIDEIIVVDWNSKEPVLQVLEKMERERSKENGKEEASTSSSSSTSSSTILYDDRFRLLHVHSVSHFNLALAYNLAAVHARSQYLLKVDCDSLVASNFIQQHPFPNNQE